MQGYIQNRPVRCRRRPDTHRKVVAIVICLHGQFEEIFSVIIEGVPLCEVA